MKRFLAFCLVVATMICLGAVASAETRDSDYFATYGIALSTPGSGKVNITFSCSAVGTASQLGVSSYRVYRYDDGSWTLVSGPHSGSYSYGSSSHSFAKTFSGVAGEKYRVSCTFTCVKNGTSETKSYTSRTVTAK